MMTRPAKKPTIKKFNDPNALAEGFLDFLLADIGQNKTYNLALSGGSTPKLLFSMMARKQDLIPWDRIRFFWGDERCVKHTDPDSNYGVARDMLFSKIAPYNLHLYPVNDKVNASGAAAEYENKIQEAVRSDNGLIPVFDLIMLGMGADGHTASIFPHQMELLEDPHLVAVGIHPDSGQSRVTFTGKLINAARKVVFLVTGESKQTKVAEILHQTGGWRQYPAAHIDPANGELYWYLDDIAAARL